MTLNEYQEAAHATSKSATIGGDILLYPVLGLAGEVGELLNKVKKNYRDSVGITSAIILCACADGETCHRKQVGEYLAANGWEVREVTKEEWEAARS